MRIVHINFDADHTGGATIAALRIHQAVLSRCIDSIFVYRLKSKETTKSQLMCPSVVAKTKNFIFRVACKLLFGKVYSVNWVHTGMASFVNALHPDVVHLHWIKADTIGIEEIATIRAPIVWSLHDLWPCLGSDSYPKNDWYKTGYDDKLNCHWIDRWTWHRKMKAFHGKPIFPVGPSEWCAQEARKSLIFSGHRVESIPYPVDVNLFVPDEQQKARDKWGIPSDRYVLLYGANMGTQWPIKGFDRLVASLPHIDKTIRSQMQIVVFGEMASSYTLHDVPVQFVGKVLTAPEMATLYPAADLFVFPSRQETFGQTKSEAMACGVPVLAFNQTACPEGIQHQKTGWVAECDDFKDFARGIEWGYILWSNPEKRDVVAKETRAFIEQHYSLDVIAKKWQTLYTGMKTRKQ